MYSYGIRDIGHGQWDIGNKIWDIEHSYITLYLISNSTSRLDSFRLSRFRDYILIL
jgi:hypothetical protein